MAFDFGSDILADAIRTADPAKVDAVRTKLETFSKPGTTAASVSFREMSGMTAYKPVQPVDRDKSTALQKYEAAVLGTFIEAMMPNETGSVYGQGFAGEVWKSQLSQAVAVQLARRGGLGIASRLLNDFTVNEDKIKPLSGVTDASAAVERNSGVDAVTSFIHSLQLNSLTRNESKDVDLPIPVQT